MLKNKTVCLYLGQEQAPDIPAMCLEKMSLLSSEIGLYFVLYSYSEHVLLHIGYRMVIGRAMDI